MFVYISYMVNIAIDTAHIWTQNIKGNMYLCEYVKKKFNKYAKIGSVFVIWVLGSGSGFSV